MNIEIRDLLRVHTCAFNGRDLETFASHAHPDAACFCDGEWVGEGPDGIRRLLEQEYARAGEVIGREELGRDGPVIVEFSVDGRERRGALHIATDRDDGRIREMRIDHPGSRLVRLGDVPEPGR